MNSRLLCALTVAVVFVQPGTANPEPGTAREARPSSAKASEGKPNVLLILADDLGFSDLGCYGGEIATPHLDRLAKNGVRFSAFYNSARCCPSRASLMTGLHPHQAGIGSFTTRSPRQGAGPAYTGHLLPNCATLAEMLGDAGYSTWMVGKWHMGIPGPIARGFQNYYGYRNFLAYAEDQWDPKMYVRLPEGTRPELSHKDDEFFVTDVFSDYALEFLRQARTGEEPWFLYLTHSSPHFPVQAPVETIDKYVPTFRKGWDVLREERFARQKAMGLFAPEHELPPLSEVPVDGEDIANGFPGVPNPHWDSLDADRREDLARRGATFAAMVEHIDRGVGRLFVDLEKNGELENTLVLFTSDNGACYEWGPFGFDGPSRKGLTTLHKGEDLRRIGQPGTHQSYGSGWANLGNTPLNMYKHFCHEGGITSPLIAHWPKALKRKNTWVHDPTHIMDIVPTVLEAAGAEYPLQREEVMVTPVEGTSLLGAMEGAPLPERTLAFEHQRARGLRMGDWKIVWGKRQPDEVRWELYNLKDDRSEQVDLAREKPTILKQLVSEWETWAKRVGAEPFHQLDAAAPEPARGKFRQIPTPKIKDKPIFLKVEFEPEIQNGVLVAHGGREHGYALHLLDGHLAFDVRVNGKVTRIAAKDPVVGRTHAVAALTEETISLHINEKVVAEAQSPGLIPVEPKDGLNVGYDDLSAAGDYQAPNRFQGEIHNVSAGPTTEVKEAGEVPRSAFTQVKSDRKPGPVMDAETIRAGLKSHDRALYIKAGWIRDPYIVLGPDDFYYLTGTQPNEGDPREAKNPYNLGLGEESIVGEQVRVWRSRDLISWENLGPLFTLADTHHEATGKKLKKRLIWAPEVHWLGDRWALVHCPSRNASLALSAGKALEGPWTHPMGDNLGGRHDPSLFTDDNGTVYVLWANTMAAPLSKDLTRYTAEPVRIDPAGTRPGPDGQPISRIGHEGATMIKVGAKYVHLGTAWSTDEGRKGSYNLYYCTADKITGPYGPRKFAGRFLGHGTPFQDRDGKWWCTAFFNANTPPLPREGIEQRDLGKSAQTINEQGVTIVPLEVRVLENGEISIRAKDPDYANPGPDEAQSFR